MADEEKDRLGRTIDDKRKGDEERFFAERDRRLLAQLRGSPAICPTCGAPRPPTADGGTGPCPAGHGS